MENLYDKLKPEIRKSIKKDLEKYPASTKYLMSVLKNSSFWSDLRMCHVQQIISHSHNSFVELSFNDIVWGDKFLIEE